MPSQLILMAKESSPVLHMRTLRFAEVSDSPGAHSRGRWHLQHPGEFHMSHSLTYTHIHTHTHNTHTQHTHTYTHTHTHSLTHTEMGAPAHTCWGLCAVLSCSVLSDSLQPHGLYPSRFLCPWDSPGKNTRVGFLALLQGISLTQRLNPGLLHYRRIL